MPKYVSVYKSGNTESMYDTPSQQNNVVTIIVCLLVVTEGLPAVAEQDLSPVWVPDDGAAVCMHCRKTQFTLINRRVCVSLVFVPFSADALHVSYLCR